MICVISCAHKKTLYVLFSCSEYLYTQLKQLESRLTNALDLRALLALLAFKSEMSCITCIICITCIMCIMYVTCITCFMCRLTYIKCVT